MMEYVLIRLKVKDYGKWRVLFDARREAREASGLKERDLYRSSDDPNEIFLFFAISDKMRAKEYLFSEEEQQLLYESGLEGEPDIYFLM